MFPDFNRHNAMWSRHRWRASEWFPRQRIAKNLCKLLEEQNQRCQAAIDLELKKAMEALTLTKDDLRSELVHDHRLKLHHLRNKRPKSAAAKTRRGRRGSRALPAAAVFLNSEYLRAISRPQIGVPEGPGRLAKISKNRYPIRRWAVRVNDGLAKIIGRQHLDRAKVSRSNTAAGPAHKRNKQPDMRRLKTF